LSGAAENRTAYEIPGYRGKVTETAGTHSNGPLRRGPGNCFGGSFPVIGRILFRYLHRLTGRRCPHVELRNAPLRFDLSMSTQKTISPIDGSVYVERALSSASVIENTLTSAVEAQRKWQLTPLSERKVICEKALAYFLTHAEDIGV